MTADFCFISCVLAPVFPPAMASSSEVVHSVYTVTIPSLSGTPVITTELSGKNYWSQSSSVKMWFRGHGVSDQLSKHLSDTIKLLEISGIE